MCSARTAALQGRTTSQVNVIAILMQALQSCADDKIPKKVVSDSRNCPRMPENPTRSHPKREKKVHREKKNAQQTCERRSRVKKNAQERKMSQHSANMAPTCLGLDCFEFPADLP